VMEIELKPNVKPKKKLLIVEEEETA
jgi:hypothetical protein